MTGGQVNSLLLPTLQLLCCLQGEQVELPHLPGLYGEAGENGDSERFTECLGSVQTQLIFKAIYTERERDTKIVVVCSW